MVFDTFIQIFVCLNGYLVLKTDHLLITMTPRRHMDIMDCRPTITIKPRITLHRSILRSDKENTLPQKVTATTDNQEWTLTTSLPENTVSQKATLTTDKQEWTSTTSTSENTLFQKVALTMDNQEWTSTTSRARKVHFPGNRC